MKGAPVAAVHVVPVIFTVSLEEVLPQHLEHVMERFDYKNV